jgi:hypothetical protein
MIFGGFRTPMQKPFRAALAAHLIDRAWEGG